MRKIYFIRHARPDIPFGERWCVGSRTDIPLGTYGKIQASLLRFEPELNGLNTVFCSSLSRSRETALAISSSPVTVPGLEEQDMGIWDGLSFTEIRTGWPELYAIREHDPEIGRQPHPALRDEICDVMMSAANADDALKAHCRAVADLASGLCGMLTEEGMKLNAALVRNSALLHDIARAQKHHPEVGAKWLLELGYPDVAEIIRRHHDFDGAELDEAALVFLADKCIEGDRRVTIGERFAGSASHCRTQEAKAAHASRLETALQIKEKINRICGKTVIE